MNFSMATIQNPTPSYLFVSSPFKDDVISQILEERRILMELDSTDVLLFKSKEHGDIISLLFNHINQNGNISFDSFLKELIEFQIKQHVTDKIIHVNYSNLNSIQLNPFLAVSLALFSYEIIHNSFLYAFTEINSPLITVEWRNSILRISDNGSGFLPMLNSSITSEKSLYILKFISSQLRAKLHFQQKGGSSIAISLQENKL